jgi:hypothetical protein
MSQIERNYRVSEETLLRAIVQDIRSSFNFSFKENCTLVKINIESPGADIEYTIDKQLFHKLKMELEK